MRSLSCGVSLESLPLANVHSLCDRLGDPIREAPWLRLALAHRSHVVPPESAARVSTLLKMLEDFGLALAKLCVYHYAATETNLRTPKECAQFEARATTLMIAGLASTLGLRDIGYWGPSVELARREALSSTLAYQVIAALHLSKSLSAVQTVLRPLIIEVHRQLPNDQSTVDYKSRLQEHALKQWNSMPIYQTLNENGPEHNKTDRKSVV